MTKARDLADNTQNAKPKIVDAKGDLIAATAADTVNRLAVGANGETLVADSSTSTGLRYTAGTVQDNPVLNSSFQVWQRGTSISQSASTTPYTADRWQAYNGANQANTISRQTTGDTTNLPNVQYNARFQRNSGQTGTADIGLFQSMESVNSIPFAGKTVTVSFYARRGANFSATSNLMYSNLYTGTGTDQNILTGYTGSAIPGSQTNTLTTTWQRFTMTVAIASSTTEIALGLFYQPTGTAGAADYFDITGVQIDIGSVALPFRTNGGTIQGELAACQRYYYRATSTAAFQMLSGFGTGKGTTQGIIDFKVPATMRVTPTTIDFANVGLYDYTNAVVAATSVTIETYASPNDPYITVTCASGITALRPYAIISNNTTGAYVGIGAEL
jgi:hypothetical protein